MVINIRGKILNVLVNASMDLILSKLPIQRHTITINTHKLQTSK